MVGYFPLWFGWLFFVFDFYLWARWVLEHLKQLSPLSNLDGFYFYTYLTKVIINIYLLKVIKMGEEDDR